MRSSSAQASRGCTSCIGCGAGTGGPGVRGGSDVGGTWYWNRYPGARFDSQGDVYQYWFSKELYKGWKPSERFPAQPEIERWLQYVADRLDLRTDIQFGTRIEAHLREGRPLDWSPPTAKTSIPSFPRLLRHAVGAAEQRFPGQDTFKGSGHTYRPGRKRRRSRGQARRRGRHRGHRHPGHPDHRRRGRVMTVFARTPQYMVPMKNPKYTQAAGIARRGGSTSSRPASAHLRGFEYDFENRRGRS